LSRSFQQFDDEEGDADETLAPLPDETEVVDEQEEPRNESIQHKDVDMDDRSSEMPSSKPHLTLMQSNSELDVTVNEVEGLHHESSTHSPTVPLNTPKPFLLPKDEVGTHSGTVIRIPVKPSMLLKSSVIVHERKARLFFIV
jgi:hypothetical protein